MKRWHSRKGEHIENNSIDSFLFAIEEVCNKHNFSISHEDHQGAFVIEKYTERNIEWLFEAHDKTYDKEK